MSRPTNYNQSRADTICDYIINGESINKISQKNGMPARWTIHRWLNDYPEFADKYHKACQLRRERKFEELEEIAENEPDVARARLKTDVLKWQLAKEEPKKYGDKVEFSGDKENPVRFILGKYGYDEAENVEE